MTKRKPVLVLFIITAIFLIAGAALFAVSTLFTKDPDLKISFLDLNKGIIACFSGKNQLVNIASIAGTAVIFIVIPLIVHLVRKQHSVTIILLIGSLVALYVDLLLLSYSEAVLLPLLDNISSVVSSTEEAIKKLLLLLIGLGLIGVAGVFELITFIVDMCIRAKREPKTVPTAQAVREEPAPAPAPAEEPKAEEKPEEPKEEPAPAPAQEPEVVEEPKEEEKKPEPQQTVININVVGVQPAEEKKEEPKEEEEKPAPKKAPAKKAPAKKEEKKPAKKAEPKKAEPKKEEKKPASRETTTIKKPARETQTIKKAEVLTNEEGKQFAKAYHISQRKELNKWQVKGAGSDKALKLFDTQKEAIEYANELSAKNGAAVRVHSRAGKMRKA